MPQAFPGVDEHAEAVDRLLREAGYDPNQVRGLKTPAVLAKEVDCRRRQQWAARNRLKGDRRQLGLLPPSLPVAVDRGSPGIGVFVAGLLLGKML